MASEKIQLRRVRSFGDTLNDVLQFLKQEFKPLLRSFFLICGIFILAGAVIYGIYYGGAANIWTMIFRGAGRNDYPSDSYISSMYGVTYFLSVGSSLLVKLLVYTVVASYLKVYDQKNSTSPTVEEVWTIFKRNVFFVLVYGIILMILILLGTVLCLAPGVYLGTVFAPFACVIIIEEDKSLGNIFNRCFTLIKENFWPSLGLYIVCIFLYSTCASIIGLVVGGITGLISYFTTKDVSIVAGLVTGIMQIFSAAFSIILYLAIGLQYFSLEEKENGTGLMSRIQNMNNDSDDQDRSTVF